MKLNFKIKESVNQINSGILNAFLPDIKTYFNGGVAKVKNRLPKLIGQIVTEAPEYHELVSGRLMYELGIPDAAPKVISLINLWASGIKYKVRIPTVKGRSIVGSFDAALFKADFSEVIDSPDARVYDALRGYELPWLKWLLFDGNVPLVNNYTVNLVRSPRSRTGQALMVPSSKSWSVPATFSGTIDNNWITRSISSHSSDIEALVNKAFQ